MSLDERQIKHLEWIQNIISRQAANSFLLKGWSITLVAGLFALADKSNEGSFLWLAWLPVIAFGFLDAFYLHQEKRYIALFNWVQRGQVSEEQIRRYGPLCLDPGVLVNDLPPFWKVFGSPAVWGFYGPLLLASLIVPLFIAPDRALEDNTSGNTASVSIQRAPKRSPRPVESEIKPISTPNSFSSARATAKP